MSSDSLAEHSESSRLHLNLVQLETINWRAVPRVGVMTCSWHMVLYACACMVHFPSVTTRPGIQHATCACRMQVPLYQLIAEHKQPSAGDGKRWLCPGLQMTYFADPAAKENMFLMLAS